MPKLFAMITILLMEGDLSADPIENPLVLTVEAPSLAGNKIGDPAAVSVVVYLPPSYQNQQDRFYPVVYHLDGFDDRPRQINRWKNDFDELMGRGGNPEFLVVEPDQYNALYGSLFANSPVTGNWEDFVVHDLVSFIDAHFRTLKSASSRALTGFYTGGGAAVRIAMKHPQQFSEVLVWSPALMKDGALKEAMAKNFFYSLERAVGAVFSPNLSLKPPHAEIPQFDGSSKDAIVIQNWERAFGHLEEKVQAFEDQKVPLRAVELRVGANDAVPWVYEGTLVFAELLKKAGSEVSLVVNRNGGDAHELTMSADSGRNDVLPFFRSHPLDGQ